jgi:hypothetical protein
MRAWLWLRLLVGLFLVAAAIRYWDWNWVTRIAAVATCLGWWGFSARELFAKAKKGAIGQHLYEIRRKSQKLHHNVGGTVRYIGHIIRENGVRMLGAKDILPLISSVNLESPNITKEWIANHLYCLVESGHFQICQGYCCGYRLNIGKFRWERSALRLNLVTEITTKYGGQGITRVFYLDRAPGDSPFIQEIGEYMQVECLCPHPSKLRPEPRRGEHIIIVDEIFKPDGYLERVIEHFHSNVGAKIIAVVIVFGLKGFDIESDVGNVNSNRIQSLIAVDLKVKKSHLCPRCQHGDSPLIF